MDQIVSGQSGMIPRSSRNHLNERFTGATIFVDQHTDFVYVHLMQRLDGNEMMAAKLAFEQKHEELRHQGSKVLGRQQEVLR